MRSTVGFGIVICLGVILLPLALLFLLYLPPLGALLVVLSLAALLTGSIGVVGGWRWNRYPSGRLDVRGGHERAGLSSRHRRLHSTLMPYWVALVPALAFVGVVGAVVSLIRGRPRSALAWLVVGVGAIVYAIAASFADA